MASFEDTNEIIKQAGDADAGDAQLTTAQVMGDSTTRGVGATFTGEQLMSMDAKAIAGNDVAVYASRQTLVDTALASGRTEDLQVALNVVQQQTAALTAFVKNVPDKVGELDVQKV